ncbi:MAG: M48 family metallopeptidase [Oscillospiraceae bacterium]|nr:M48 family metallopeptidase [Oscillospiraceae bacterium]
MTYTLTRSKRKTVALHISDGEIEVRAPLRMPVYAIDEFIASKETWINKHLKRSGEQLINRESFSLNYGDTVYILNTPYTITQERETSPLSHPAPRQKNHPPVFGPNNEFYIPAGLNPEKIKKACIDVYRKTASYLLIPRTKELAGRMSVFPGNIKITSAKTRWGSCSPEKNISFSWRLLMADEDTVDYVIIHELAHIIEMNHSQSFWNIVAKYCPDYKAGKKKLKALQNKLANEDW